MELRRRIRRFFSDQRAPVILMYHRIADPVCDPWALSVPASRFEQQMRTLRARRIPLSLADFVSRLKNGTLPALAVAVTFDDGYVDNLRVGKPILEKIGVPATMFLTTGYLGTRKEFWWDELSRLILAGRAAVQGTVVIAGRSFAVHLPALADGRSLRSSWRAWEPPRTARELLYIEIWRALQVLAHEAREHGMDEVRRLFGGESAPESDLPMSPEDAGRLAAGAHIDIGAHSKSHQPLTTLPMEARRCEIAGSRAVCESIVGTPVHGFAYPHGDRDMLTKDLVRQSGFQWACSTERAAVDTSQFDLFDLPRLQACDWTPRELERALNSLSRVNWAQRSTQRLAARIRRLTDLAFRTISHSSGWSYGNMTRLSAVFRSSSSNFLSEMYSDSHL
jgi:peptidoglycan/xylan/chitin deacetylase (PgdA/CDA1 family)